MTSMRRTTGALKSRISATHLKEVDASELLIQLNVMVHILPHVKNH